MIVHTESGSSYEFTEDMKKFRRLRGGVDASTLRQDAEWLDVLSITCVEVGSPMFITMPALDPPQFEGAMITSRMTTKVTRIDP